MSFPLDSFLTPSTSYGSFADADVDEEEWNDRFTRNQNTISSHEETLYILYDTQRSGWLSAARVIEIVSETKPYVKIEHVESANLALEEVEV